jgi:hypothetical protein
MMMSPASQGRARQRQSSREFTGPEIAGHVHAAIPLAAAFAEPWVHWRIADLFPRDVLHELADLPLRRTFSNHLSGRREYHSERIYLGAVNMARFPLMRRIAEAMQSPEVTRAVAATFAAPVDDTFLRIEYAVDTAGFWLEPHTDIGVKKFTCFVYLDGAGDLGTDIYADSQKSFASRVPFVPNSALAFIPGGNTWHGFAPRPIEGVRRSLIINYVGAEWRAREQLSFPDSPVRLAR